MVDSISLLVALVQAAAHPFSIPLTVAEPDRLALTPKLDGKIDAEEWDELVTQGSGSTFFQWQPGAIHAAANLASDQIMVVSLDLNNNGWLQGKENVEVRVKWAGDKPECKVRILDATGKNGPVWTEAPMYQDSISCAAAAEGDRWTAELTLVDPGIRALPEKHGDRAGVRIDLLSSAESDVEPFVPRVTTPLRFALERGSNLPGGLKWKPEFTSRAVAPGSKFRIRMTFNGANELDLRKAEMRSEGFAKDDTAVASTPFPSFDKKGRAFVDYNTPVPAKALDGYRIMRTTITDGQGQATVLRTSYVIAPIVVFSFGAPGKLKVSDKVQMVKCSAYARSNTTKKVDGVLRISPPENWRVESGDDKNFTIYNSYGSVRRVFELSIPAGAKGTFPIKLQADLGGKSFSQTAWVTIG